MFDFLKTKKHFGTEIKKLEAEVKKWQYIAEVRLKTLEETVAEKVKLQWKLNGEIDDWNRLVKELKQMGGMDAIRRRHLSSQVNSKSAPQPFTPEEIRILIQMSHPDKHSGKKIYSEITQKLVKMR